MNAETGSDVSDAAGMPAASALQEALAVRLRWEAEIAWCGRELATAPVLSAALDQVLPRLLDLAGGSCIHLFENFSDPTEGQCARVLHEAVAPGVPPEIGNPLLQRISYRWLAPEFAAGLAAGQHFLLPFEKLSPGAQRLMAPRHVCAILTIPVFVDREWWGYLGLDNRQPARPWRPADLEVLQAAAAMIGQALERRRHDAVAQAERDLAIALCAATEVRDAMSCCIATALEVSGLDSAGVSLTTPEGGLDLLVHRGVSAEFVAAMGRLPAGSPPVRRVLQGAPLVVSLTELSEAALFPALVAEGMRAFAAFPVNHQGRVFAAFFAGTHVVDRVPSFALPPLETIAALAGGALARLRTAAEQRVAQEGLQRRDAILRAVAHAAEVFLEAASWEERVKDVLEAFGQAAAVSRVYVFANRQAPGGELEAQLRYQWPDPERSPAVVGARLSRIVYARSCPRWRQVLSEGGELYGDTTAFPADEQAFLRDQGIVATVMVPIFVGPDWWGFIGCDECHTERPWTPPEIEALRTAASIFAAAIRRDHAEVERRALLERVQHMERMEAIGHLAEGVAHDFNNLLTAILGAAEMLAAGLPPGDTRRKRVEDILSASGTAAHLTEQLLAFARKSAYQPVLLNLHQVIVGVASMLEHSLDGRIAIRQVLEAQPAVVMGDQALLQSALLNLAVNARDAMPHGGELSFGTRTVTLDDAFCRQQPDCPGPGRYLQLTVRDTGTGMTPEVLRHAFQPFFTTKPPGQGTGLGLSAVYGIVKKHNGAILVESAPDRGATFTLYFPLAEGRPLAPAPAPVVVPGRGRILLVEDRQRIQEVLGAMLQTLGYEVVACDHGAAALERFQQQPASFALVLLDMVMPVLSGRDTFFALRTVRPEVKVLLMSAYPADHDAAEALAGGAVGLLRKPVTLAALSQALAKVLTPPQAPG